MPGKDEAFMYAYSSGAGHDCEIRGKSIYPRCPYFRGVIKRAITGGIVYTNILLLKACGEMMNVGEFLPQFKKSMQDRQEVYS